MMFRTSRRWFFKSPSPVALNLGVWHFEVRFWGPAGRFFGWVEKITEKMPRWWFQIFFSKWSNLTIVFQMGWNHQLDAQNKWRIFELMDLFNDLWDFSEVEKGYASQSLKHSTQWFGFFPACVSPTGFKWDEAIGNMIYMICICM